MTPTPEGRLTPCEVKLSNDLHALVARVVAFEKLMDERDRRYSEGKESDQRAVAAALAANEKLVNAAFAASKEAIAKQESGQTVYNATHNDLTRKMDAQYGNMMPRAEAESRFVGMEEKINDLRLTRGVGVGKDEATETAKATNRYMISLVLMVAASIVIPLVRAALGK